MPLLTSIAARRRPKRRRSRLALTVATAAAAVASIAAAVAFSYEVGRARDTATADRLLGDLADAREKVREVTLRAAEAEQRAEAAIVRAARLQQDLDTRLPKGDAAGLLAILQDRLAAGVPARRLATTLRATGLERACEPSTRTGRVAVHTAETSLPATSTAFAEGRIVVTAEGVPPARAADAPPGAGFDPAAPVVLRFLGIGREVTTVSGVLPLTHATVLDGREYRFLAGPSPAPGALDLTVQVCRFP